MAKTQSSIASYELLLVFENWALASEGATVTADSTAEGGNLWAANLGNPGLDVSWRSGSISAHNSSTIKNRLTLGDPSQVDWVSLHRSNIRVPFKALLYKTTQALASPVFESDWTDPIVRASPSDFSSFSEMPFTLGPSARDLDRFASLFALDSFIQADKVYRNVRVVEIIFDVSSGKNEDTDYLQYSLPFVSKAFRPSVNMELNWDVGVVDRSLVNVLPESGGLSGRKRSIGRTFNFMLGYLKREEAFQTILTRWLRQHGKLRRVFAWPEPHQRRFFYDLAMVATLKTLPKSAMAHVGIPATKGFQLEETE